MPRVFFVLSSFYRMSGRSRFTRVKGCRRDERLLVAAVLGLVAAFPSILAGADWEATVKAASPGGFAPPRPVHARYRFGWSGFTAATGDVHLSRPANDRLQLEGTVHTTGLVRTLWKLDASHHSLVDARTLRPLEMKQNENSRSKKIATVLAFDSSGVTSKQTETPGKPEKTRRLDYPNLFDLYSALLYLRSQSLEDGAVYRLVAYPATSSYLATVTVVGRDRINVAKASRNAIKLDLQLNKIGKNRELEPHRKFRHGTVWISDDPDRVLLRIEAQVFVGTVFAELQSVEFEDAKGRGRRE